VSHLYTGVETGDMEIKREADSNEIVDSPHDQQTSVGMFDYYYSFAGN